MSYEPGLYEADEMAEAEKCGCPVKKFILLGAIVALGTLLIKWAKDK